MNEATDIIVTPVQEPAQPKSQPIDTVAKPEAQLDDAAVRAAIASAEAQGLNPETLTIGDLSAPQAPEPPKAEVPAKFLKPDGEVDVEKIKASTKQLDEAIQTKEAAVQEVQQKSIEDYLKEYREKEAKFRSLPNPEKIAQEAPKPSDIPLPANPDLRAKLAKDLETDPFGTLADLVDVIVAKKMEPVTKDIEMTRAERKENAVRENIANLAKSDPRVLNPSVFQAINQRLQEEPELWRLKNPHKAAWLQVKEELRLGEYQTTQAQPSKAPSPVLGGGTPPSAPSSQPTQKVSTIDQLDIRNKQQEAAGDEFIRQMLARERR